MIYKEIPPDLVHYGEETIWSKGDVKRMDDGRWFIVLDGPLASGLARVRWLGTGPEKIADPQAGPAESGRG